MPRWALPALAALVLAACTAYAVQAVLREDAPRAGFAVSAAPLRQAATPGERISFDVTVRRRDGFTGPVALRARDLPPRMRARWRLDDGTGRRLVPPGGDGAVMVLVTSAKTPPGRTPVTIRATGGGRTVVKRVVVTIEPRQDRRFTLVAQPFRREVLPGGTTTYRVRLARAARSRHPVHLSVTGLPRGARAVWSPARVTRDGRATLRVTVAPGAPSASARVVVRARARVGGKVVRRATVVVLDVGVLAQVVSPRPFDIGGDLGRPLFPGARVPLDLALTNPQAFPVRITGLRVAVRDRTSSPACSGAENFRVDQYSGPYPIVLPPGDSRLGALVPDSALWPHVAMLDLPSSQDACKSTGLTLEFDGRATE